MHSTENPNNIKVVYNRFLNNGFTKCIILWYVVWKLKKN